MIGQRGVPATWGGVEHHVEEIGARLADRGHHVTVYCRPGYGDEVRGSYRGMRLRHLPAPGSKHLEAIGHSLLSSASALLSSYDVVHYHALGPGVAAILPRYLSGARVAITVHGLDDQRAKWSGVASRMLRCAGWLSARVPDATVVVSNALVDHYRDVHRRTTLCVPNGMPQVSRPPEEAVRRWGLQPGQYALFVGRLVPEKAPDELLRAFRAMPGDVRLVVAGGSSHTDAYAERVRRLAEADPRVLLPGYVYGENLAALYAHAGVFVLPSHLEGLPLTLLEAIAHGAPVVASDIPPHREILGRSGPGRHLVPVGSATALAEAISAALHDRVAAQAGANALRVACTGTYSWDRATDLIESLYLRMVNRRG